MSRLVIRRATAADAESVARLRRADAVERKSVAPAADPGFEGRLVQWFATVYESSVAWLAEVDGTPVGMLHMFVHRRMPMPGIDTSGWAYVGTLFVLPEHRNAGLGKRLLDTAFDYVREHGLSRILLHPTERAVPLYRRAAFTPADRYLVWDAPTA